ncbi:hypothetical protein ACIF70_39505 [Actinacidiphila glaucinigra]
MQPVPAGGGRLNELGVDEPLQSGCHRGRLPSGERGGGTKAENLAGV